MSFYAYNITLRNPSEQDVAGYLNAFNRRAYVSPTDNGFTILSDELGYDRAEISELALGLSKNFSCLALAVQNENDAVFWYRLYKAGKLIDEYDSNPDYHIFHASHTTRETSGGNPITLAAEFGQSEYSSLISAILRDTIDRDLTSEKMFVQVLKDCGERCRTFKDDFQSLGRYAGCNEEALKEAIVKGFAVERMRHAALVAVLRLPWYALLLEYDDIEDDAWPADGPQLIFTPEK